MKRGKKMLALLLTLAVLVGGYFAVTALTKEPEVTQAGGEYAVADVTNDNLTAMEWTYNDQTITLQKTDTGWQNASDAAYPLDQQKAQTLADTLTQMKGTRELTGDLTLSDYGLAQPAFTVKATTKDGATVEYLMGDATALTSEYYVKVSGKDAIYTVADSLSDVFSKGLNELAQLETIPAIGEMSHVALSGALDQTYDAQSERWARTGTQEWSDTAQIEALNDEIKALAFDSLVTYSADTAKMAEYGLADGQTLTVESTVTDADNKTAPSTLKLMLGGTDAASGNRYAKLEDSQMVYLIKSDSLTALSATTDDTLRDKTVSDMTWDDLRGMTLAWNDAEHVLSHTVQAVPEASAAPEASEASTTSTAPESTAAPETAETVTFDGAFIDAQIGKDLLSALTAKATGAAGDAKADAAVVLRATLTGADGQTQTLTLREYNASSYYLESDCERKLLVSADGIDQLVRQAKALVK